jgi:lysophospholipase L1-like esterase
VALGVAIACLVLPGTGAGASPDSAEASQPLIRSVLFMGDSIAYDLAPAVVVGLESAGLEVATYTFAGVSLSGDAYLADGETWLEDRITQTLEESHASVVIWQLSVWDLPEQLDLNRLAHTRFVDLALPGRIAVIFVTAPPLDADAYPWWSEDWTGLDDIVGGLADDRPGRVLVADASPAWGDQFAERGRDGLPLRKPDGVHVCPHGATIFADFLAHWLDDYFAGVTPSDPSGWSRDWWTDTRYDLPPESCPRQD